MIGMKQARDIGRDRAADRVFECLLPTSIWKQGYWNKVEDFKITITLFHQLFLNILKLEYAAFTLLCFFIAK